MDIPHRTERKEIKDDKRECKEKVDNEQSFRKMCYNVETIKKKAWRKNIVSNLLIQKICSLWI